MKIYLVKYGWFPSAREGSVVLASSVAEAFDMVKCEDSVLVDKMSQGRCKDDIIIEEVTKDSGIIYTGHHCC